MENDGRQSARRVWQWTIALLVVLFFIPGYEFFNARHGLVFLNGTDFSTASRRLFPLAGLYAFFLVWFQVMLGVNRQWLQKVFPGVLAYHRRQGVFVLLFALLHPLLLISGVGLPTYFANAFVSPEKVVFVWLGRLALFLIVLTVGSAFLRRISWLRTRWRIIHYLNFVVFIIVWIHSWNLGSDVQSSGLRYLWYFYGLTFVLSVIGRFGRRRSPAPSVQGVPLTPPTK